MKTAHKSLVGGLAVALSLTGCVGPVGPSPGLVPPPTSPGVASDDLTCRQYADAQVAPMRDQANAQGIGSALVGAGLGAALGAAVGGGRGAAIGAASGGILGTGVGAANAQNATAYLQQQYNMFYANCMAARHGGGPGYGGPPPGYGGPGYGGPGDGGPGYGGPGYGGPGSGYGGPPPGTPLPPPRY